MNRSFGNFRRPFAALLALLALALGVSLGLGTVAQADDSAAEPPVVPGEVLVLFEDPEAAELSVEVAEGDEAALAAVPAATSADGEASPEAVISDFELEDASVIADDLAGQSVVSVELSEPEDAEDFIAAMDAIPGVMAQPNYRYELIDDASMEAVDAEALAAMPNDKHLDLQYYLQPLGDGSGDSGVDAFGAWDELGTVASPSEVTVAVMDTGIDPTHPDLQKNIRYDLAYDAVANAPLTHDVQSHGTNVAGVIAATADNEIGVAGTATGSVMATGRDLVSVVPINVFRYADGESEPSANTGHMARGINYLIRLMESGQLTNLKVLNMSLGYYVDDVYDADPAIRLAIDELTSRGVLCVAAGGNGNGESTPFTTPMFPSDYPSVLSVTALTEQGANSSYSDYNLEKDISAPGDGIATTEPTDGTSGYAYSSGTSLAAPIVSGSVALMASANPALSPAELIDIVKDTAAELPSKVNSHGSQTGSAGALDARAAVAEAIARTGEPSTPEDPANETVSVYRLYNKLNGAHLITSDYNEYATLTLDRPNEWKGENLSFKALPAGDVAVHRLYNPANGDHFYTASEDEVAALQPLGWKDEGVSWYGASAEDGVAVNRYYNRHQTEAGGLGNHLWTMDADEIASLSPSAWSDEGVAWYVLP